MGSRGPRPLPANVHRLRGNASHLTEAELGGGVHPDIAIPDCPKHLLPEARKFWRRLTPELEALGLISKIDQAALALVCQEWAWLVYHERALQRDIDTASRKQEAWEAAQESKRLDAEAKGESYAVLAWTGGDGFSIPTANGHATYNTHWVARNRHVQLLDRFLASFGMSPSSRGRVTPSTPQLELPGMDTPKEGFGAL